MVTVSLDDDAPLGPNDFRFDIDDDVLQRFQTVASSQGQAWEDFVIHAVLGVADPLPHSARPG